MDGCIAERPKLLIWSKNTYKQEKKKKKKKTHNGMGKVEAGSRKEKEEEEGADLLPPPFRSVF